MPLEKLQKQILTDAWKQADEIEAEARRQAEGIMRHAKAAAKESEERAQKELETELERTRKEEMEGVELQGRALMLDARNHTVENAYSRLRAIVAKRVKQKGYDRLISRAIEEASEIAPQEELTLLISKKNAKLVRDFGGRVKYNAGEDDALLQNKNGSVRVLVSVSGLIEKMKPEMETMLIREAFSAKRARKERVVALKKRKQKRKR